MTAVVDFPSPLRLYEDTLSNDEGDGTLSTKAWPILPNTNRQSPIPFRLATPTHYGNVPDGPEGIHCHILHVTPGCDAKVSFTGGIHWKRNDIGRIFLYFPVSDSPQAAVQLAHTPKRSKEERVCFIVRSHGRSETPLIVVGYDDIEEYLESPLSQVHWDPIPIFRPDVPSGRMNGPIEPRRHQPYLFGSKNRR